VYPPQEQVWDRRTLGSTSTMLLVEPATDPLLKPLSTEALSEWLGAVGECDLFHTDILDARELDHASEDVIAELEDAALVARLPFGNLRVLARGWLWDFDRAASRAR
jgi:hypothetical protein